MGLIFIFAHFSYGQSIKQERVQVILWGGVGFMSRIPVRTVGNLSLTFKVA